MQIAEAVERLNRQLPLQVRQAQLDPSLRRLHRAILHSLVERGRAPTREEMGSDWPTTTDLDSALRRLGDEDLIVLDAARENVLGAYPITTEETPHRIRVSDRDIYAMCALDALSVGPMFGVEVEITSRCRLTDEPIHIRMRERQILDVQPSAEVHVGIRWQMPRGHAAHSMCMEMVFLKDKATARAWQGDDTEHSSLFGLSEAVEFGAAFFMPLLG